MMTLLALIPAFLLFGAGIAAAQIKVSTEKHGPVALGDSPDRAVVVVTPASKIRFLEGCRRISDNPLGYTWWIRVVIDGEEGWVPNEQTEKIGLMHAC